VCALGGFGECVGGESGRGLRWEVRGLWGHWALEGLGKAGPGKLERLERDWQGGWVGEARELARGIG
jgi:hypothetical protein